MALCAPGSNRSPAEQSGASRSAPSMDAELLTTLPAGTVLDYVGAYNDTWSIINYNGGQAYVATRYVDVQEEAAGAP